MEVRPNLIVLSVGLSGSSLLVAMLEALGWVANDPDPRFHEMPWVSEVNNSLLRGDPFPGDMVDRALTLLRQPWVLKDPRLVRTLEAWTPFVLPYRPMLLWLERDFVAVRESYRKRGMFVGPDSAPGLYGLTVEGLVAAAAEQARLWPGPVLRIRYESLLAAASLARSAGQSRGEGGLWL